MTADLEIEKPAGSADRYKWVALSNTTVAMFMSALDGSIVIIVRGVTGGRGAARLPVCRAA